MELLCYFKLTLFLSVRAKFGITDEEAVLVLERDGSVVDGDFELLTHLSQIRETVMILEPGQMWTSPVVQVSCVSVYIKRIYI